MSRDPRIDAYIAKAAPFARPILEHVRARVHSSAPEAEETMKWSAPGFTIDGKILLIFRVQALRAQFLARAGTARSDASGAAMVQSVGYSVDTFRRCGARPVGREAAELAAPQRSRKSSRSKASIRALQFARRSTRIPSPSRCSIVSPSARARESRLIAEASMTRPAPTDRHAVEWLSEGSGACGSIKTADAGA